MVNETTVSKIARIRGWLLIVLGACLIIGIAVVAAFMASTIAHNDQPGRTHWTGSHEMTVRVFQLFAALFVFGIVSIAGGIFQLRRGRASWVAMVVLLGLVAIMYFLGQDVMRLGRQ